MYSLDELYPEELKKQNWCIDIHTQSLLQKVLMQTKPKLILEIGGSIGYSALFMACLSQEWGGNIFSIESNKKRYQFACKAKRILHIKNCTFVHGHAPEILSSLSLQPDCIFLDCIKSYYLELLHYCEEHFTQWHTMLADNTTSHSESLTDFKNYCYVHYKTEEFPQGNGTICIQR